MAVERPPSMFGNSVFPTNQCQFGINVGNGNTGGVTLPFVSQQEQEAVSYMPWSHNAHDDPYEFINSVQSNIKNRKPYDNSDCDGETDLQGLVSNILDEADSHNSNYSEGGLGICNHIWSPKTLKQEPLNCFQSEPKTLQNPFHPQNYASRESFSKSQGQSVEKDVEEFCQQSNGFVTNQQWLFNLSNGDKDSYPLHSQKLPPGLPLHNTGNGYPETQLQGTRNDNASADNDSGTNLAVNNFPDLSYVFRPQSEMNSPCFDPYYEDNYAQSCAKSNSNEQYLPQDISQLVNSLQEFMGGGPDSLCCRDFPNLHKQTFGDSMVEQWKITSPAVSTQSAPAVQAQKQLVGDFGLVQREKNGGVRKQPLKHDGFQDLPGFSSQNPEYFQQMEQFCPSLIQPNQYQNKLTMQKENIPIGMDQYSQHHIQQGQIQSKHQMQKDQKMVQMSSFPREGFATRSLTNTHLREAVRKPTFSQNLYFNVQGGLKTQKFNGENLMVTSGNAQQHMPLTYPVNDFRGCPGIPINSSFKLRPTLSSGSSVLGMGVCDTSGSDSAAFKSYVDTMTNRGEKTYHGMASAMRSPMMMNPGGPLTQLHFYVDECYEEWKCLEREGKKTETILTKTFPEKQFTALSNTTLPRTPPNPTRVDHLIVKLMREQAKVKNQLHRMECLSNIPLHISIHTAQSRHHMSLCITQARRKEEIANKSKHQQQRRHFTEERDIPPLMIALKDLAAATRKLRTELWCALQMTLPKPVKRQKLDVDKEATCREGAATLFERYYFKL